MSKVVDVNALKGWIDANAFEEIQAPLSPACVYTYSAWGPCQPNGTQTRTVIGQSPVGCVGTPILSQSCVYSPSPPADPIPSITGMVGVHWGTTGGMTSISDVRKYYINLPDGLPAVVATPTTEARKLIPKGTPYSLNLTVVDGAGQMHGSQFDVTLTLPNGTVKRGELMESMTMISFYQSAPPGRYLVTIKATKFAAGETSARFILGFNTTPWLIKGELK